MQPGRRSLLILIFFLAVVSLLIPTPAAAHAILLESNPAPNGKVAASDIPIKLRFNVRIDASRSRLTLVRPDGSVQLLPLGKADSADILSAQASNLPPGDYRLRWQALASDGHITRGEIPFTVTLA
jgi:copper resistance protein C